MCVYMCANLDFSNILTRMNGHNPGLFTQKSHTQYSDPQEKICTIQGYFISYFVTRTPIRFPGHIVSFVGLHHRVYRVSEAFFFSRPNGVPPPLTSPPLGPGGRHTRLRGREWRGTPLRRWDRQLWYSMYTIIPLRSAYTVCIEKNSYREESRDQSRPIPS